MDPHPFPLLTEKKKRGHKDNSVSENALTEIDYNNKHITLNN